MSPVCGVNQHRNSPMNRFVVISGCSGGGKSTLLAELARRGQAVVEEPGRGSCGGTGGDGAACRGSTRRPSRGGPSPWLWRTGRRPGTRRLGGLRSGPGRCGRRAGARDGRSRAGAAGPRPSLSPAGVPGPALAGNLRQRPRATARLRGGAGRVRPVAEAYEGLDYAVSILPKVDVAARADFVVARVIAGERDGDTRMRVSP
jgi:hypothetical protein